VLILHVNSGFLEREP